MNKKNQEIDDFFTIVQRGVRKHGPEKVVRSILSIDIQETNIFYFEIFNYIINETSIEFGVEPEDLFRKYKAGNTNLARKIAIVLVKSHFEITDEQLAEQFHRTRQVIYNTRMEFLRLKEDNPKHILFQEKYDLINKKVISYIKKIKGQ